MPVRAPAPGTKLRDCQTVSTAPDSMMAVSRVMTSRPKSRAAAAIRPSNPSRVKRRSSAANTCAGVKIERLEGGVAEQIVEERSYGAAHVDADDPGQNGELPDHRHRHLDDDLAVFRARKNRFRLAATREGAVNGGAPRERLFTQMIIPNWTTRFAVFACFAINAIAQSPAPAREIPLYPGVAPGSENWHYEERAAGTAANPQAQNIVRPALLYYPADKAKAVGTAMIVAPGGGYRTLMMSYEGVDVAKRFNQMGIDAFVLKYRTTYIGTGDNPQAGQNVRAMADADGQQAVRLVRQHAAEYGVEPTRVGMIGFSAGGGVLLSSVYGPADGRPDFAVPIYAAGASSAVPPVNAPPLFIAVASDDKPVGYQGSIDLFGAWIKAGLKAELHIFQMGAHGFVAKGGGADSYLDRIQEWLKVNGLLTKTAQ